MKNLISKNPVQRFQSGKKFDMSRLIRRSDGKYQDKNGNIVTGDDGNLLGDAWKYLAGKYDRDYANRVSWNTRNKNIYQNGKWRADYKPSKNRTVDWNTATNNGKAPKYFTDSKTGKKTYFNKEDIPKPVTKPSNKPKVKHKYEGNDLVTSKVRIRNARDHNYLRDAYQRQILPADGIKIEDLPAVLQPQKQLFQVNPLLLFSRFGRIVPSFPSLTQNNKLLGSQKLLGAPNYNGVSVSPRIQTGNNWQWADVVPLNRKGGNIQKHQKGSNLLYTWGKTKGSKGLDAVGVQKGWRDSDRFNKFMQGKSDDNMQSENDIYDYLVEANGGNHFGNTQELQKFINFKLSELSEKNNKNYGSIVVDNKFGNQTEEGARLVYELLKNGPTQNAYMAPTSQVSNKYSNPGMQFNKAATRGFLNSINARYTDDLISGIMNMKEDDLTRQQIYSRAGITSDMDENAIRDRLGNTFAQLGIHGHLGGNDKRRFRNWFNTQETPQSAAHIQTPESVVHIQTPTRNLFSGLDNWNKQIKSRYSFLRKGGLISKNPVERFNQSFIQGAGQ